MPGMKNSSLSPQFAVDAPSPCMLPYRDDCSHLYYDRLHKKGSTLENVDGPVQPRARPGENLVAYNMLYGYTSGDDDEINVSCAECAPTQRVTEASECRLHLSETNSSGYHGVTFRADGGRKKKLFRARIRQNGHDRHLGNYATCLEAAVAVAKFTETRETKVLGKAGPRRGAVKDETSATWPYACDHKGCNKRFMAAVKLKIHKRKHSSIRPYVCDHSGCGKKRFHSYSQSEVVSRSQAAGLPYDWIREDRISPGAQKLHFVVISPNGTVYPSLVKARSAAACPHPGLVEAEEDDIFSAGLVLASIGMQ